MWNGCSEMRDRERMERGEILNEDGWMKAYGRGERTEIEWGGGEK
jgi:hypothetical protein